ncbi:hypothetical protein B7755_030200 [Streptomyces sp. NBS 14/10]|uniref:hypothetical protein n=1 Tax=Streptomyces sp. NBS 14/10 TaxID=1945643 RepID=UPI000B802955|nr:hypothetical protein [Streptomyces sp. NBS 14/10]KAK1182034.1 hypothetical protein B7755_030200 [Streptomyces sp. NBS 14/10]NUP37189.1 hypothetical protein [Streptomyces sp.]NUS86866.1 hypothetical protein [Streptomyces sp.]
METVVTVAVIAALIAVGVVVIHRLNAQHGSRVSALRYGDTPPGQRPLRHHRVLSRWRQGHRVGSGRKRRV